MQDLTGYLDYLEELLVELDSGKLAEEEIDLTREQLIRMINDEQNFCFLLEENL